MRETPLFGRQRELGELHGLLTDPGIALVTLTGMGGVGKTSLALEAARRAGATFADGVSLVPLAAISVAGEVVGELARALGVRVSPREAAIEAVKDVLRRQRMLIVLDNFEQVLDAAGVVAELLDGCPGVSLLVTSRAPLRIARERVYQVPVLAYPSGARDIAPEGLIRYPAVALFVDRARARDPAFEISAANAPAISELCGYLGGLPLAVELAAARASVLSPQAMLGRLRDLLDLHEGWRDAPERQQTLRATIEWSYRLLAEPEQILFVRLAVFVGSFTAEAAEEVIAGGGLARGRVLDGLARLVDHGLIQPVESSAGRRFGMLEPVREYAWALLEGDPAVCAEIWARHSAYYVRLAMAAEDALKTSEQLTWLPRLNDEQANLLAVLRRCATPHEVDRALQLATALENHWPALDSSADLVDWLEWSLERSSGDRSVRAKGLLMLGWRTQEQGDLECAIETLDACVQLCESIADRALTATAYAQLACVEDAAGNCSSAAELVTDAMRLISTGVDRWTRAFVLHRCAVATREYPEARHLCQQSLVLFRSLGDHLWCRAVSSTLGYLALIAGDLDQARTSLQEAARLARDEATEPALSGNLGLLELLEHRDLEAGEHFARAVALGERAGLHAVVREALNGLAAIAANAGDAERATQLAAAAEALYDGPRLPSDELMRKRFLAGVPSDALGGHSSAGGEKLTKAEIDEVIADISRSVGAIEDSGRQQHDRNDIDRVVASLLMTDIVDSTRRATALGDAAWLKLLDEQVAASRHALRRFRGTEVKDLGDGLLASFDAPADAIRCAHVIGDASRQLGLDVRAGVHIGECDLLGSDVRGIAVHITARVCALARAGEVLVSEEVRELASRSGVIFTLRGRYELRGLPDSRELFAASGDA